MAFITLAGTLLDPTSEFAVGDQIRFTHKSTTGETVAGAVSLLTIDPSGTYSINLQYGLVLVEYKDARKSQFENRGVATVNGDNPATSIPELLNALVPVSSAELIEFQAILADAVTAETNAAASAAAALASEIAAAASAATLDLINDLSQSYAFLNDTEVQASSIVFPLNKYITVTGAADEENGLSDNYIVRPSRALAENDILLTDGKVAVWKDSLVNKTVRFSSSLLSVQASENEYISRVDNTRGVNDTYRVFPAGTESTSPDAITLNNGLQAVVMARGGGPQSKVGIYTTPPEFSHKVGSISYRKHSPTQGELITRLDKYRAALSPDAGGGFWKELYVDPVNGSDLNDGLTWETAIQNADAQSVIGNYSVLHLKAGIYHSLIAIPVMTKTLDTAIVCDDGVAIMCSDVSNDVAAAWTLSSGSMYSIDLTGRTSTITSCVDLERLDKAGNYKSYTWRATQAEVIAEAGTYTYAGTFAYVHTLDGLTPTKDRILLNTAANNFAFQIRADQKYYLKNVHFMGGTGSLSNVVVSTFGGTVNAGSTIYAEGCKFGNIDKRWGVGNALELLNIDLGIFDNCGAGDVAQDGFNYHGGVNDPHIIEVNCYGGNVGIDNNDNASTAHEAVSIFRLNCNFGITTGPCVVDVNDSLSYNACLVSYQGRHNLQFDGGVKAWVNGYTGHLSSINDIYLTSGVAGVSELHVLDNHTDKAMVSDGIYTIDTNIT